MPIISQIVHKKTKKTLQEQEFITLYKMYKKWQSLSWQFVSGIEDSIRKINRLIIKDLSSKKHSKS